MRFLNAAGACGYGMAMKQASRSARGGPVRVKITAGTEDDLVPIVGILNYTAANSTARFETRPVSVAERRDWFGQFSATGPYRLDPANRVFRRLAGDFGPYPRACGTLPTVFTSGVMTSPTMAFISPRLLRCG
jgi:hypothetical protein